jgi:clathrin heavy chain
MNVTKLLRACEKAQLWNESVYLYKEDGQHDSAVRVMIEHPDAFANDLFLDCVQKVGVICHMPICPYAHMSLS